MVRIYCLTCISKIPPRNIETTPYENNADETTFIFGVSNDTPKMIQLFFENAKYYQLTEICIGFEKIGNMKRYVMNIFREDTKLYVIPMHRGAVTFTKFSNNVHELYVATSKLFSWKIDFDLLFKIRSIKNTIHKAFMTKEEKELYDNYSKRMKSAICLVDDDFVAWENISSQIERLYVIGGDGEINEVNLSDKNNLEWLQLCHTTLKNLKCTNLPSSLTDLNLSNNKLTHFDMENNLPLIEELHLNNNNLIQIVWETLSPKLQYIGFDNNQIESIGNISHLIFLEEISANFNQIKILSFGDFNQFEWLNEISLSNNLLSALPEGFENLKGLRILDLNKNEFNYFDTTNLEDILWKRLPRELKTLNLSGNNLHQLPCFLKDFNIENLIVVDCKISHICPYIYAKSIETDLPRHFDISKNPLIALPFIPQTIIEPPLTKRNFVVTKLNQNFKITSENAEFLSPFLLNFLQECDESNHQFPTFEGEKVPINCYCCAKCGNQTEEKPVEQIMIVDYLIEMCTASTKTKAPKKNSNKKRSKPNQKKIVPAHESDNYVVPSEAEVENTDVIKDSDTAAPPQLQQYSPGNWKTKVITKLCKSCIKSIQTKAKDVLKLYEDKYLLSQKSKKQFKSMKNFFAATIDAIEGMDKLKNSLQLSAENKSDIKNATRRFELSEFLHPNISKILDLRQALPWLYQDEAALSELLASFDSESKKLIEFSYETSEICFCQQQQLRNVIKYDSCFTLEITAPEEYNGTFDALLSNWSAQYSQELCGECNNYIYIKNNLKIGAEQNYLIVEINASEKMSGSIFHNNFTSYFIFGALWSLVGAIELQNCSEPRNYITWQRYENGKWKCIKNGRHWFKNDFPQNLKSFPILIFEKLSTIFIPPNNSMSTDMPFESNLDNSVMNYAEGGLDISPAAYQDRHLQPTFYPQHIPELYVFHTGPADLSSTQLYPEVEQHPSTSSQFYQYYSAPIYQNEQQQYFEQSQQPLVVNPNTMQQPSESANDQPSLPPIHTVIQGKTFQNL
uniref:Uncharacterized protein n=1 Tax=Panagrolaimus sp. ES5 TaxID=591445 RepID=A0AC34GWG3_9BILA